MISFFLFSLGTIIGSFLNVCIYRLPQGKSIISPGSHCPYCNTPIRWYENIPILSFIFLKGRCRYCKKPISWQYPLVEFMTGLFTLIVYHRYGLSFITVIYLLFIYALIVISFIDLKQQIIPDEISLPGIAIGLLSSLFLPHISFKDAFLGTLLGGGSLFLIAYSYYLLTKREGMGGGDIKLLAMIGAFLGWKAIPLVIFISSLIGSFVGIIWIIFFKKDRYFPIPFGPFLSLGAIYSIFFPNFKLFPFP